MVLNSSVGVKGLSPTYEQARVGLDLCPWYHYILIVEKCKKCYTISIGSVSACEKSRPDFPWNKVFHHKK